MAIFSIGDTVIYGIHGICKITDIQKRDFMGEIADYFILSPIYDERSTVFVPCENENLTSKMKRINNKKPDEKIVWFLSFKSYAYNTESIEDGRHEYRKYAHGSYIADNYREQLLPFELTCKSYLVDDRLGLDNKAYENTGDKCYYWHKDAVAGEIKEVKQLHTEYLNVFK
jgi:CarD family transcriptional regulator